MTLSIARSVMPPSLQAKAVAMMVLLCSTGCAIHPQTQDYSGVTSRHIARQIRCETREAVIDAVLDFLRHPGNEKINKVNDQSRKVGNEFEAARKLNPEVIRRFHPGLLSGNAKNLVDLIWKTGIAYNYNLEMEEINNNGGGLGLINDLPTSNRSFGFGAKLNLERQNTRIFTITDTFGKLVTDINPRYCDFGYQVESENFVYPLTGKIGMRPVVGEFATMAVFDNLSGDATKDFSAPVGLAQMAEQLEFTTTIDVSVAPKIVFAPLSPGLSVAEASFTAQTTRKDYHKLTLGLFVPKGTPLDAIRGGVFRDLVNPSGGSLASTPVRSPGEAGALSVVNQALLLKIFQRRQLSQ